MLRLCVLLSSLVVVAMADGSGDMSTPTSPNLTEFEGRFNASRSVRLDQHFYCLGYLYDPDMTEDSTPVMGDDVQAYPEDVEDIWTLWFQYPVISFIDVTRKQVLFSLIVDLIRSGAPNGSSLNNITLDNLCLGPYIQDDVYRYSEGVILYIYFRDSETTGPPLSMINVDDVDEAFLEGLGTPTTGANVSRVVSFRGHTAIYLLGDYDELTPNDDVMSFHNNPPGSFFDDRLDDPTFNAVFVGSWTAKVTKDVAEGSRRFRGFASNPNPINYGLEAGDVVFAVFGSIFLTMVMALFILGYFIDPFFLNM